MPKFSIKDLLVATAFVAVGLSMAIVASYRFGAKFRFDDSALNTSMPFVLYVIGWVLTGIGIMYPFRQIYAGATVGGVVGVLLMRFFL